MELKKKNVAEDKFFFNKTIFITGCSGTVGSAIIDRLLILKFKPKKIIGIDNNESAIFYQDQKYSSNKNLKFFLCDIRNYDDLVDKMKSTDIVFHCAALKHVSINEKSPFQTVLTNIIGVQNIINASKATKVKKVIFTSSDKAVNPTNVMGTSKLMGERLITAANSNNDDSKIIFASTRFGNVLGSSGSVYPIFKAQILSGYQITLTSRDMTRFIMSIDEAVDLVLKSAKLALGGEVFVTKMPVIRILDLANAMIEIYKDKKIIGINEVGARPGEKLYEELMSSEETQRAIELSEYFCILPAFEQKHVKAKRKYPKIINKQVNNPYISQKEKKLSVKEIKNKIKEYNLI